MTNHIHLLIERQADTVGNIMQRVLTGYSQYYNRKYRRVGHVFQGRHKAILCQSDQYLSDLVRYIHLNPVRARMVALPEDYQYSSHRAYLDIEPEGVVDVDPVLRRFAPAKKTARERFREFVALGMKLTYSDEFESPLEGDILGSQEFVDSTIHRIGDVAARRVRKQKPDFDAEALISAVGAVFGMSRDKFCGPAKTAHAVLAKEALILTAREAGASVTELSNITHLDTSTVSRRSDAAKQKLDSDSKLFYAKECVEKMYRANIAELQV